MNGIWITVALGACLGLAMTAVWHFGVGSAPTLDSVLNQIDRPPPGAIPAATGGWRHRVGRRSRRVLSVWGLPAVGGSDARIAEVDPDLHAASKVVCAVMAPAFVVVTAALCALGGVTIPTPVLVVATLAGMAVGFVGPDLTLHRRATERRHEFTVAFGAYLDLVAISLAGGMGTEAALTEAARVGNSWVFHTLRRTIDIAQIDGTTIWEGLRGLGDDLNVPAVIELASSVALAGSEGAKVRNTISVKADGLRTAELAAAESRAQAATERMAIPTAMLLFGFVLLIGFPAVITVLDGL